MAFHSQLSETLARFAKEKSSRIKLIRILALAWIGGVCWYFSVEAFCYSGIFAKVSEWQFITFDQAWPMASFLLLVAIFSLPALLGLTLLGMPGAPQGDDDPEVFHGRRTLSILKVAGLCFALASVACLAPTVLLPGNGKPLQNIEASRQPEGRLPEGPVRLTGIVLMSRMSTLEQNLIFTRRQLRLAPMLPAADQKAVRYLVQVTPAEVEADRLGRAPKQFEGVLVRQGLPGSLRVLYNDAGIALEATPLVLYRNPSTIYRPYRVAAAQCALFAVIALLGWLRQRRHVERLIARGPRRRKRDSDSGMILGDDAGLRPIGVVVQEASASID